MFSIRFFIKKLIFLIGSYILYRTKPTITYNYLQLSKMSTTEQTKRVYKKQPLVLKKFLDSDSKKLLIKFTKSVPKTAKKMYEKNAKEAAKQKAKEDKEAAKQAIKDEKQAAKDEKKAAKEAAKQAIKDEKLAAKNEKKAAKEAAKLAAKNEKKAANTAGNIMSVINLDTAKAAQETLVDEAKKQITEELQTEAYVTADDLVAQANIEIEPKKVTNKKRGRPRKSDIEINVNIV